MTIFRSKSYEDMLSTMKPYLPITGFEPEQWLANGVNVALSNEDKDFGLFERQYRQPNMVCGHYFFNSRGKKAYEVALEMLREIFTGPYNVEVIVGMTPLDNKGALWMNKKLGFKSCGQIDTEVDPCELVMLTKTDWEKNQHE